MKKKVFSVVAIVVGLISTVILCGCQKTSTEPTPVASPLPTAGCTVNGNNNIVNCGNGDITVVPSPSPSGSPGATLPAGSTVKIGAFGVSCPAGVTAPEDAHTLKIGCQTAITCTPKGPNGELLDPNVTGSVPEFFGVKNGAAFVTANPWEDEKFNLNVFGKAVGEFDLGCTVKGVSAELWHGVVVK